LVVVEMQGLGLGLGFGVESVYLKRPPSLTVLYTNLASRPVNAAFMAVTTTIRALAFNRGNLPRLNLLLSLLNKPNPFRNMLAPLQCRQLCPVQVLSNLPHASIKLRTGFLAHRNPLKPDLNRGLQPVPAGDKLVSFIVIEEPHRQRRLQANAADRFLQPLNDLWVQPAQTIANHDIIWHEFGNCRHPRYSGIGKLSAAGPPERHCSCPEPRPVRQRFHVSPITS